MADTQSSALTQKATLLLTDEFVCNDLDTAVVTVRSPVSGAPYLQKPVTSPTALTLTKHTDTLGRAMTTTEVIVDGNNAMSGQGVNFEPKTSAFTLTATEKGKIVTFNSATGFALTLPPVSTSTGYQYRVMVTTIPTSGSHTLVTGNTHENVIQGNAVVASDVISAVDEDTVTFLLNDAKIGDYVDVACDGTNWYVTGVAMTAGSLAFSTT